LIKFALQRGKKAIPSVGGAYQRVTCSS